MPGPVSELLREARQKAGLSQRELAERARTTQSVVGRIEAGLVSPRFDTLERLLAAAGFQLGLDLRPRPVDDRIITAYKRDIDRTLLRENLRKTPEERVRALRAHGLLAAEAQRAGRALRRHR